MSTYARLARLPLTIDRYRLEGIQLTISPRFERHATIVRLESGSLCGLGEDTTYDRTDQQSFQAHGGDYALAGSHTLESFSRLLSTLELFPTGPSQAAYRDYRRWAFESAALDLALRQAGTGLAQLLERPVRPVRFVSSRGLGSPPSVEALEGWKRFYPELEWKLDSSPAWDEALLHALAATDRVRVVDFKGAYQGTAVDQPADAALYRRVAEQLPGALLEDPAWTRETAEALESHRGRISWDAPIHSVQDLARMPVQAMAVNLKPSRFGTLERLFAAYDHCREREIAAYGGGQFELAVGRGQIQYLAGLFHSDAPNDVAPIGYNVERACAGLPSSPLTPAVEPVGFRWLS